MAFGMAGPLMLRGRRNLGNYLSGMRQQQQANPGMNEGLARQQAIMMEAQARGLPMDQSWVGQPMGGGAPQTMQPPVQPVIPPVVTPPNQPPPPNMMGPRPNPAFRQPDWQGIFGPSLDQFQNQAAQSGRRVRRGLGGMFSGMFGG